jgi:hypothetical protein
MPIGLAGIGTAGRVSGAGTAFDVGLVEGLGVGVGVTRTGASVDCASREASSAVGLSVAAAEAAAPEGAGADDAGAEGTAGVLASSELPVGGVLAASDAAGACCAAPVGLVEVGEDEQLTRRPMATRAPMAAARVGVLTSSG